MTEFTTHIAGYPVTIACQQHKGRQRVVQRCALCGYKMVDRSDDAVQNVKATSVIVWEIGTMVRFDNHGNGLALPGQCKLPPDYCRDLIE